MPQSRTPGEPAESIAPAPADLDLINAAQSGRRDEFETLVERYQSLVCSLAYALTGDLALSEEIAQETFIVVWRKLSRFRAAQSFRPWLYGITRNQVRNFLRRARHRGALPIGSEVASGAPSPLDDIISREQERSLWGVLGKIPEAYRVPLVLFYREDRPIQDVAETLNLSVANVKKRLSRGRRMLQAEVAAALLEPVLSRTRPGRRFTAAVMLALPTGGQLGPQRKEGALGAAKIVSWKVAAAVLVPALLGGLLVLKAAGKTAPVHAESGKLAKLEEGQRSRPGFLAVGEKPAGGNREAS